MYNSIFSFENLYLASKKAQKGKRSKESVAKFWLNEDREILKIHKELKEKRYKFGKYTKFTINDSTVQRRISSAPFRDRVVHHAIMNVIEPIFENRFIDETYANRKGKGVYSALKQARYFAKKYQYYLKLDVKKYFPSIDHQILKEQISEKIECKDTEKLIFQLIDNSNRQDNRDCYFPDDNLFTPFERRRGIPLGNLTSQFFGNVYVKNPAVNGEAS